MEIAGWLRRSAYCNAAEQQCRRMGEGVAHGVMRRAHAPCTVRCGARLACTGTGGYAAGEWGVQVVRLREDNAALMETLVRTKVELAETQGAPHAPKIPFASPSPCVARFHFGGRVITCRLSWQLLVLTGGSVRLDERAGSLILAHVTATSMLHSCTPHSTLSSPRRTGLWHTCRPRS